MTRHNRDTIVRSAFIVAIIVMLVLSASPLIVSAIGGTLVADFESGSTTPNSADWGAWQGDTGNFAASDVNPISGSYSGLKTGSGSVSTYRDSAISPGNISFKLEKSGSTGDFNALYIYNQNTFITKVELDNGNINIQNGGSEQTVGNYQGGPIHVLITDIDWGSGSFDLYVEGRGRLANDASFANSVSSFDRFRLESDGDEMRIDDIRIDGELIQPQTSAKYQIGPTENFANGDITVEAAGWQSDWKGDTDSLNITTNAINGAHSGIITTNNGEDEVYIETENKNLNNISKIEAHVRFDTQTGTQSDFQGFLIYSYNETSLSNDLVFDVQFNHDGDISASDGTDTDTGMDWQAGVVYNVTYADIDFQQNDYDLWVNGNKLFDDADFENDVDGFNRVYFRSDTTDSGQAVTTIFDDIEAGYYANETAPPQDTNPPGNLTVDIKPWMDFGSTQNVRVYREGTEVTSTSNITSGNTSVISVSGNSLTATSFENITETVIITIEEGNNTVTKNVTVAARTLENIEILPSSQWHTAALGCGESGVKWCMGSEIQWILVAIFIGAAAAWKARNEWLGIGVIIGVMILLWVLDYVSLGPMLVALFYGIFAAYQLQQTPSRSDTNVGDGI